ncbi:class I SAM-dependent methyltransferase [Maritalea sp.]|jgi:SAM-dependent methyltransferase|uniref:class I SAM-dependent methyltransferase n=1 Tax=Maritalea sp. TaxID=2003361 RepID=UPI0039E250D5
MNSRIGASFENAETVDLYLHRPPYPQRLYDLLIELSPSNEALLDLGCGHGKIARHLAPHFDTVTAVDPSKRMMALGQKLENGKAENLHWVEGLAEDAPLSGKYDTVVAALSIHWMDHARLFPKLAKHLNPNYLFGVIEGDDAHEPPWQEDLETFLGKWVPELTGKPFVQNRTNQFWTRYTKYVDVTNNYELISEPIVQSLSDFILCQHSRDTFAISKLGDRRERFDAELEELLRPHADENSNLTFKSCTRLATGKLAM